MKEDKTYYIIYRTICKINLKEYIGAHATQNLEDDYIGSGKILKLAIKRYGRENFEKTILHIFENSDEMYAKEREIVSDSYLSSSSTYNLAIGGTGYASGENHPYFGKKRIFTEDHKKHISDAMMGREVPEEIRKKIKDNPMYGRPVSEETRKKQSAARKGKKASDESKRKRSEKTKGITKPKVECPVCKKLVPNHVKYRYHFDNCKNARP